MAPIIPISAKSISAFVSKSRNKSTISKDHKQDRIRATLDRINVSTPRPVWLLLPPKYYNYNVFDVFPRNELGDNGSAYVWFALGKRSQFQGEPGNMGKVDLLIYKCLSSKAKIVLRRNMFSVLSIWSSHYLRCYILFFQLLIAENP